MSTDIACQWNSDISFATSGDFATIDGAGWTQQRFVRRLLTAVQGYVWQPLFGAGLPQQVGTTTVADQFQGIVAAQAAMETGIDQSQPITVTVVSDQIGDVSISVTYTDAQDGSVQTALVPIS